jgi:2-keto-4-pentenoate hydratase
MPAVQYVCLAPKSGLKADVAARQLMGWCGRAPTPPAVSWAEAPRQGARYGKDLRQKNIRISDVIGSIEYAICSIEVLDSRIVGWDIGPADSIADNGSGGAHVLGTFPRKITDCDLVCCGMVAKRNGRIASLGVGAASMTNPLFAVRWLAEKLARTDRHLIAGDVVLSGSLGPMVALAPGDVFEVEIGGFGAVCIHLAG